MALKISTQSALRSHEELAALVRAVAGALPEDEAGWLEWKIAGDLSATATQGTIARHILGMANRMPHSAAVHAGGCGYLIMGVEPGNMPGIVRVDHAVLVRGVQPYLGADGPVWSHHYDEDGQGVSVLVVTVEPPQDGQRAFTLRKGLTVVTPAGTPKTYLAGTVFVRRGALTEQANPGEVRALEDRFAATVLASARAAEADARRNVEFQQQRQAAEDLDRRRAFLMEMLDLVVATQFKAAPYKDLVTHFRCAEQLKLQSMLAGMDYNTRLAEWQSVKALAGEGQAHIAFGAAVRARQEIEVALHRLGPPL
jgi:hypothetical protein